MDELTKQVRYQKWAEIILAANNSGLTKSEFCKQNGISRKTLYNYQKKSGKTCSRPWYSQRTLPLWRFL